MTSTRAPDSRRLDVAALAATGAEIAGEWPQEGFARLALSTLPSGPDGLAPAPVSFHVAAERAPLEGGGVYPALRIDVSTQVRLECQRCLQPMLQPLRVDRRFFFVPGEDAAAALDAETDDDVLELTPALDLHALVEDELLLALPIVPRHEACPEPMSLSFGEEDAASAAEDHPFAALAALKTGGKAG
jgi:uncharacterized protein